MNQFSKSKRKRLRAQARKARKALAREREQVINEHSSAWGELRELKQAERQERWNHEAPAIMALREEGYSVLRFTPYHYRINDKVDVFPSTGRWHLVGTEKFYPVGGGHVIVESGTERRGRSLDLVAFIRGYLPPNPPKPPKPSKPVIPEDAPKTGDPMLGPWRLFNLKTGTFASDIRHHEYTAGLNEKLDRIRNADPRVRDLARLALYVVQERDLERQSRKQAAFDKANPRLALKRGTNSNT